MNDTKVRQLKPEILRSISTFVNPRDYRIFIFGSRANGTGTERSDIDIGIEGPEKIPGHILTEIREALEHIPTLYSFDVVDFQNVSERFKRHALRHIDAIT